MADIATVIRCGRRWRQPRGRLVYYVGHRDVKRWLHKGVDVTACQGLAVIIGVDGAVITVVRTEDLQRLRRRQVGTS